MSIETYDPAVAESIKLTFTSAARKRAESELAKQHAAGLRLSVKKSGCSGFRYLLDFVDEPSNDDIRLDISADLTLYIDADARDKVEGTEIDFVTEGLNSSFQFSNPNAAGVCGCGESFTVG